jgi:hypothetical protein
MFGGPRRCCGVPHHPSPSGLAPLEAPHRDPSGYPAQWCRGHLRPCCEREGDSVEGMAGGGQPVVLAGAPTSIRGAGYRHGPPLSSARRDRRAWRRSGAPGHRRRFAAGYRVDFGSGVDRIAVARRDYGDVSAGFGDDRLTIQGTAFLRARTRRRPCEVPGSRDPARGKHAVRRLRGRRRTGAGEPGSRAGDRLGP